MAERMLTRREAAAMLARTPVTLARWSRIGYGPRHIQLAGGQALYRPEDLLAWLRSHEVGGQPEEETGGKDREDRNVV